MDRESSYSYECNRCNRCCHNKRIALTPYDLIRLSEVLNISTGELIREHTDLGVFIRNREEGSACRFLGEQGCTVHSGRPAACRVYPLGRIKDANGEQFCHVVPHPQTEGVYGNQGRVQDYLDAQGLAPYFEAMDEYHALFHEIADLFAADTEVTIDSNIDEDELIDVDLVNAKYAQYQGLPTPQSADERFRMHVRAVRSMIS